jgi:hypothetical protein
MRSALQQGVAAALGGELACALQLGDLGLLAGAAVAGFGLGAAEGNMNPGAKRLAPRERTDNLPAVHDAVHVLHSIGVQLAPGGQACFAAGIETGAVEIQVAARLELDVLGVDARRGGLKALFGVLGGGRLLAQPAAAFFDVEGVLRRRCRWRR